MFCAVLKNEYVLCCFEKAHVSKTYEMFASKTTHVSTAGALL